MIEIKPLTTDSAIPRSEEEERRTLEALRQDEEVLTEMYQRDASR